MAKRPAHIEDDDHEDSVEFSNDLARAIEQEEPEEEDDEDEDDFPLLGDDTEDDDVEDDDDGSGGDDDGDDGDDDGEEEESLTAVPRVPRKGAEKPKNKTQARIEELAAKRRDAEAEAFKAEMEVVQERKLRQQLEERIAALESGTATPTSRLKKPDPADFHYGEVDNKYVDALVEYRLAEERDSFQKEQGTVREKEEQERQKAHYMKRLDEVKTQGAKKFGAKFDAAVDTAPFPAEIARDMLDSDFGVDISYYLANNISKLRELSRMDATQRAKAMGRLEERFSARSSAGKKTTNAPDTPGRKASGKKGKADPRYGPDNQDDFDRAFFGR